MMAVKSVVDEAEVEVDEAEVDEVGVESGTNLFVCFRVLKLTPQNVKVNICFQTCAVKARGCFMKFNQ